MSRYLTAAIPGTAVPGFIPGRVIAAASNANATATPSVLACTAALPLPTVGARVQGKALAGVANKASAAVSVTNRALATSGVS